VIVLGIPKRKIQVKVKAFAHAFADVSERGMASIHLDVQNGKNIIKIITVLQWAHQINMQVRKTLLGDGDGDQTCVAVDLAPAGRPGTRGPRR
jgi:hypothetical protein